MVGKTAMVQYLAASHHARRARAGRDAHRQPGRHDTARALRVLREADLIAAEDTRRTGKLLAHFGITTQTVSLHEHNETSRDPGLLDRVCTRASDVAVVTDAGMPAISDPGYAVVAAAVAAGPKLKSFLGYLP